MKKKIFTLLVSSFLLSGALATVNAQSIVIPDKTILAGYNFEVNVTVPTSQSSYSFVGCDINLTFNAVGNAFNQTEIDGIHARFDTLIVTVNGAEQKLILGKAAVLLPHISIPIEVNAPGYYTVSVEYRFGNNHVHPTVNLGSYTFTVYDYPTVTTNFNGAAIFDYFYERTTQFPGKVEFSRKGGSPDLEYSFDGVYWYSFPYGTKRLSQLEIQNLIPGSGIQIREPNSTCYKSIVAIFGVPEQPELIGGIVQREVYIAKSESADAVIIPGTGLHYVPSTKNYVFKIIPTGENVGKTPEVITGRILPNEEMRDVSYEFEDGVWTVTVYGVQENLNLDVTFPEVDTQAGGSTGNAAVEGSQVWGAAGVAYVTSATSESVSVYSAAGTLVKTVVTPAGTTAIPLPAGFYILSKGGSENYKVIVK